ncbi:MAG: Ig-like domain-containing protein, partial [Candidatus Onthovivens sp.]
MKKKKFLFVSIGLVLSLTSLVTTSCTVDNGKDAVIDVITGIDYVCPDFIEIGESTTVQVDILGSDDDSALFESLNPEIATISESGRITGISQGVATIRITAKNNTQFTREFNINVIGKIPESISITIDKESGEYTRNDNKITVDLGSRLKFGISLSSENAKLPDSVIYQFNNLSSLPSSASALELDRNTGEFYANVALTGLILAVDAYFGNANQNHRTATLIIDIVDVNAQNEEAVNEIFANTLEKEKTSFKNTTISRTITDEITNTSKTTSREYYSFIDSNYVKINNIDETSYSFNGIYDGYDYAFDYTLEDGKANISQFYVNEEHNLNSSNDLIFEYDASYIYGISSIVKNRFFQSAELIDGKFYGLGNYVAKANAKYAFNNGEILITSAFDDNERNAAVDLKLALNFDAETKILNGYKFEENVKNLAESALNFQYSI